MDQKIISDCKFYVEGNDLDSLQKCLHTLLSEPHAAQPDWPYIFHRVYLHACLKGNSEIACWLEHTVYPMLDGIQKIALRQIFPYGRHLLSKATKQKILL
jgi:hypothetical protein